jgi:polyisoprenoid-binding protein YceI
MNLRRIVLGVGLVSSLGLCLAFARPAASSPAPALGAAADDFKIDGVHSTVIFRAKHLGVSYVYGRFDAISGDITFDPKKPESSKVKVEVQMESVNTGNGNRDAHLKSTTFFDAKQFPTAMFTSKSVKAAGDKKFSVTGDLTLHGVTKPVTIEMENVGQGKGMHGGELVGFHGTLTLKRSDFGMTAMTDAVSDEILLTVSFEAGK